MEGQYNYRVKPPVMEKKYLGVPVFPGPSQGGHYSPGLSTGGSPRSPMSQNGSSRPTSLLAAEDLTVQKVIQKPKKKWSIRHVDFMPATVKSKKDDDYERFQMLVDRANGWSVQNPHCLIFSCETVAWSSIDRPVFTDAGVLMKSMHSDKKTKFLRGLRVWYMVYEETFYEKDQAQTPGPFKIGYINYTLEPKTDSLLSLVAKINTDMFKKTVAGKILKVETIQQLSDQSDVELCSWTEQPDKSKDYTTFLRLFYLLKTSTSNDEDCHYGEIGIRDFLPSLDQRSPHNSGYETFADIWRKAARFVYTNPQLSVINTQSVFVKVRKDSDSSGSPTSSSSVWDRCTFREHSSSYGSLSHQKTEYYQILRVVYHKTGNSSSLDGSSGSDTVSDDSLVRKLYYKTFAPSLLKRSVPQMGEDQDSSSVLPTEILYEDLRQLEDNINSWLAFSDAKICNVETVPTRLLTGGQEMIGPEATVVYNDREKNQNKEPWRINIRLYVKGDYNDPPAEWKPIVKEKAVAATSGPTSSAL